MRLKLVLDLSKKAKGMDTEVQEAWRIIKIQEEVIRKQESLEKEAIRVCPHVYIATVVRVKSDFLETRRTYSWECIICGDREYHTSSLPRQKDPLILVTMGKYKWILKNREQVISAIRRKRTWVSIVKAVEKLLKSSKVSK